MPIKLIKGNLLDSQADLILHGVNLQGTMNSGVAKQIRERFPSAYSDYVEKFRKEKWCLGDVQYSRTECDKPRFIVNCGTQEFYGKDGVQYVSYKAIQECVTQVLRFADREKYSVSMPRIGAGLGGGNWEVIFNIINKAALQYPDVSIQIYSLVEDE